MVWDIWSEKILINNDTPLYLQLESIILKYIEKNNLKPGDSIPSEGEFCTHYGLSRSTVRQAFKQLEEKGLVIRRRGLGSFVSVPKVSRNLGYLYSFTSQLTEMGYKTSSKVLKFEDILADADIAKAMGIQKGVPIYQIERLRLADDLPMLLEKTTIVKKFCPGLSAEIMETQSLYKLLTENGLEIASAVESYEPVMMEKKIQKLLQSETNGCAFSIQRKSYTQTGEIFEYTQSVMPGQRSKLEITLLKDSISMNKYDS
ncbi:GntR family transcriptional regulator [Oscillospiraceae bacterium PP1C4]